MARDGREVYEREEANQSSIFVHTHTSGGEMPQMCADDRRRRRRWQQQQLHNDVVRRFVCVLCSVACVCVFVFIYDARQIVPFRGRARTLSIVAAAADVVAASSASLA